MRSRAVPFVLAMWVGCGGTTAPGGDPAGGDAEDSRALDAETGEGGDAAGEPAADASPDPEPVEVADTPAEADAGGCGGKGPCGQGESCRQVIGDAGAIEPTCLAEDGLLCLPCSKHVDCRPGAIRTNDLCVETAAGAGFFCGRGCFADSDCPDGYACREAGTLDRLPAAQCVPAGGECACSVPAITEGLSTACAAVNSHGTCAGKRSCVASGLTACDARTPAREKCGNQVDDDCDGDTDEAGCEGCTVFFFDDDHDGYGVAGDSKCLSKPEGNYTTEDAGDCDDHHPGVGPASKEICNGFDDDCDGVTDAKDAEGVEPLGCLMLYRDADKDGNGAVGSARCLCAPSGLYTADDEADCDDSDPDVRPGAWESCNGLDDDCDGLLDPPGSTGCSIYYLDKDFDLQGSPGQSKCLCGPAAPYTAQIALDCDDNDPLAFTGGTEICGNAPKDEDCDGQKDEVGCLACVNWYWDADSDGWGKADSFKCVVFPEGMYKAPRGGDCADTDKNRNPGAAEKCDGVDNDCDGEKDEAGAVGCKWYWLDEDGDDAGVWTAPACLCAPWAPWSATIAGDCDDSDPEVGPEAPERCNGIDDDCDGETDTATAGPPSDCKPFYRDGDGDGWGAPPGRCLCAATAEHPVEKAGDCDDSDEAVFPGGAEACNGRDDNCNGATDEADAAGCTPYWQDLDGDGFGGATAPFCLCAPTGKHTAPEGGDCDDGQPWTWPGSPERCNGVDDDCDGQTDEGACL
ncbi:MAG: putative metal-binding motif-containing protein [Deltaproteobacteria bacterium]|nr:putative metal-binding motif-containing protein [Deltaproteobacteria bacterium]